MRLTTFSDFSLRVLMYAASVDGRLITIHETARVYGVSRAHLMKVVQTLVHGGFLVGVRGRSGGFKLARPAEEISLGAVVRTTEPDFGLVECFTTGNQCVITGCCRLPSVLNEALRCFVETLDRHTLADIMLRERDFALPPAGQPPLRGPNMPAAAPTG